MPSQRLGLLIILLLILFTLASGLWLWTRLVGSAAPSRPAVATPTPAAAASGAVSPAPARPPPGYRLAGTAVGEPDSFAVVEAPDGATALYRLNDEVSGLGRLIRIEAERVVVQGDTGKFELWVAPAATRTPTPTRGPVRRASTPTPRPRPPRGGTAGGSRP